MRHLAPSKQSGPLSLAIFYILLVLSRGERHGYDIMKQVSHDSQGAISMGPGTLYGNVKRMLEQELIEESDERPDPSLDDERRRYYRITKRGLGLLGAELERLENILDIAKATKLLPSAKRNLIALG